MKNGSAITGNLFRYTVKALIVLAIMPVGSALEKQKAIRF